MLYACDGGPRSTYPHGGGIMRAIHGPTGDRKTDALHARFLRGAVAGLRSGPMPVAPASLRRPTPNRADGRSSLFLDGRHGVATGPCSTRWRGSVSRSEEHTSELQSLMSISYAVFLLNKI